MTAAIAVARLFEVFTYTFWHSKTLSYCQLLMSWIVFYRPLYSCVFLHCTTKYTTRHVTIPQYTLLIRKAKIDSAAQPHFGFFNQKKRKRQLALKNKLAKPAMEIPAKYFNCLIYKNLGHIYLPTKFSG